MVQICIIISLLVLGANAGKLQTFIVNGEDAPITPYHVHLLIQIEENLPSQHTFVGSGSLISAKHVMTTAQNVFGFNHFQAGVGSNQRLELIYYKSTEAISHEEYNPTNLNNNIAVVILLDTIEFSDTIQPIVLPASTDINSPFPFELGTISGFGYTQNDGQFAYILQRSFQRVLMQDVCLQEYPHLRPWIQTHFCARDDNLVNPSNICAGDQGGSFAVSLRGLPTLVGITTFTNTVCDGGYAAGYIRVVSYRSWIRDITGV